MPTARGWTAVGVAAALLALWAAFGERELMVAALFLAAAVVAGITFTRLGPADVVFERSLYPRAAHEGDIVNVEVRIVSSRRLRNVHVEDVVHGLGIARFAAGATTTNDYLFARYEVSCRNRGVFPVGPASVVVTDPLALTEHRTTGGRVDHLIVYPRVEPLRGLPAVRGIDAALEATRPTFAPTGGDEFFTLREYQTGDDLRKVHWPSSAKRDDLIVKQLDNPWQPRALIFLDPRLDRYPSADDFEHAVRAAASVVAHFHREGFGPELWTADMAARQRAGHRYSQAMEALATVRMVPELDLRSAVTRLRRRGVGGGALVFVTGIPDDESAGACRVLSREFTRTVVMTTGTPTGRPADRIRESGAIVVMASPDGSWGASWRNGMERSWPIASAG
jgi:uncharacterized protein (DUF58 family)